MWAAGVTPDLSLSARTMSMVRFDSVTPCHQRRAPMDLYWLLRREQCGCSSRSWWCSSSVLASHLQVDGSDREWGSSSLRWWY